MPKLSILICSLTERAATLERLMNVLRPQLTDAVEVLVETDNKEITTGAKRNKLLDRASGEYSCFIDDDDLVHAQYCQKILEALCTQPDCVGFIGQISSSARGTTRDFIHSLQYTSWHEKNGIYYRYPNHLNPVKTELALRTKFKDITVSEDKDYSDRLLPLLHSEAFIDLKHLYYYFAG